MTDSRLIAIPALASRLLMYFSVSTYWLSFGQPEANWLFKSQPKQQVLV